MKLGDRRLTLGNEFDKANYKNPRKEPPYLLKTPPSPKIYSVANPKTGGKGHLVSVKCTNN